MKRKISFLDWMLAIDVDNPQLMQFAKRVENSKLYIYSFVDTSVDYGVRHRKHRKRFTQFLVTK